MAPIVVERVVHRPLPQVWSIVTDVAGHRLPLTRVETDPGPMRAGWRFVGISRVGPFVLRDPMVVTRWEPPDENGLAARYDVVKTGRVLDGWAEVSLTAQAGDRTRLVWREEIVMRPASLGRVIAPVSDKAVAWMFTRAVDAMVGP